ncbi:hypothetical protein V8D89_005241 [Ganoderma adspersum]
MSVQPIPVPPQTVSEGQAIAARPSSNGVLQFLPQFIMRLINTKTGQFEWVEDPRQVRYAILSHVWAKPGHPDHPEQTYQDLLQLQQNMKSRTGGWGGIESPISKFQDKLRCFCETALKDGFEFGWADTCCIDKTSSSELSEAINSMYSWYSYAGACYAFTTSTLPAWKLLASRTVVFCKAPAGPNAGWAILGSKHGLATDISAETGIDIGVLTFEKSLEEIPIARRMAWAASRETTRLEDEAYSLMGIFGVNMETNYGEAPMTNLPSRTSTISAVDTPPDLSRNPIAHASFPKQYLLASSPKDFDHGLSANMVTMSLGVFQQRLGVPITEELYQAFEITPYGLKTYFPLLDVYTKDPHPNSATHCAILACEHPDKGMLALLLRPRKYLGGNEFFAGAIVGSIGQIFTGANEPFGRSTIWSHYRRLMYITPEQLASLRAITVSTGLLGRTSVVPFISSVYIPHCPSRSAIELDRDKGIHALLCKAKDGFEVEFCPLSRSLLEQNGYLVSLSPNGSASNLSSPSSSRRVMAIITASQDPNFYLSVQLRKCSCDLGRTSGVLAVTVSSRDSGSLDGKLSPLRDHHLKHPIHVHSWSFDHGSASRQIEFDYPDNTRRLSLRLTLTCRPQKGAAVRRYLLSAELRKRHESELPYPRQPLPLNTAS